MANRVLAYTITRADSPDRCRLLLETLTRGRETCDYDGLHWTVHVNGENTSGLAMVKACHMSGVVDSFTVSPHNEGQHPPTNRAIARAIAEGYDYLLRVDDDVEWITKRWLAKLVEAAVALGDDKVISPMVKGLRWQPPQFNEVEIEKIPVKFVEGPLGGICRLTSVKLLKEKPYVSDVRLPMGGGDAGGVGAWAMNVVPITFLAYCQHIRVRHAKSTDTQVHDDPRHFEDHALYQHMPYIPVWRHDST